MTRKTGSGNTNRWDYLWTNQPQPKTQPKAKTKARTYTRRKIGPWEAFLNKPSVKFVGKAAGWAVKNPYLWAAVIAWPVSSAINHLTNSQIYLRRYIDQQLRSLRDVEVGGFLEAGYLTQAAATDRQRLVQSIVDSNFNGRQFIGNEAAFYRNTF